MRRRIVLDVPLWFHPEQAGRLIGLGRDASREQCRLFIETNGEQGIRCRKYGRAYRVPARQFLADWGIDAAEIEVA